MNNKLNFVVGYKGDDVIGILPLCLNEEKGYYTPMGDEFPEHNKIPIRDKGRIQDFFDNAPDKFSIKCIYEKETEFFPFKESYIKYFLDIEQMKSIDNYLNTFSPKHRKNLKYDISHLVKSGYETRIQNDDMNEELLDVIEKYNVERFGNESSFVEKGYKEAMRNLIRLAHDMNILYMISIWHENKPVAAEFAILYNDVYTVLMGGADRKIKNVGKMLIYKHIENSINLKAKKLDFMTGADEWKKLWNFSSEMMYEYRKGI